MVCGNARVLSLILHVVRGVGDDDCTIDDDLAEILSFFQLLPTVHLGRLSVATNTNTFAFTTHNPPAPISLSLSLSLLHRAP